MLYSIGKNERYIKNKVLSRGLEVEDKIPFLVWMIFFPVLKNNCELLSKIRNSI